MILAERKNILSLLKANHLPVSLMETITRADREDWSQLFVYVSRAIDRGLGIGMAPCKSCGVICDHPKHPDATNQTRIVNGSWYCIDCFDSLHLQKP